eukprot:scaffold2406_cov19-Tisochrysis_lutea.AAC.2
MVFSTCPYPLDINKKCSLPPDTKSLTWLKHSQIEEEFQRGCTTKRLTRLKWDMRAYCYNMYMRHIHTHVTHQWDMTAWITFTSPLNHSLWRDPQLHFFKKPIQSPRPCIKTGKTPSRGGSGSQTSLSSFGEKALSEESCQQTRPP